MHFGYFFLNYFFIFLIFNLLLSTNLCNGFCKSPDGYDVPFYVIYSMSNFYNAYAYFDKDINEFRRYDISDNFPPLKIAEKLKDKHLYSFLVWNDSSITQERKSFSHMAHSKGIVVVNQNESTVLVHSLPNFPFLNSNGSFVEKLPKNFGRYVQTWLCMTFDLTNLRKYLSSLESIYLPAQAINLSTFTEPDIKNQLSKLYNNKKYKKDEIVVSLKIKNIGVQITLFIHPNNKLIDLPYNYLIPSYYRTNMMIGTWTRPSLMDNIFSEQFSVRNIIKYNVLGMTYANTQDHSKWAVSEKDICFCIADMNRTKSQLNRAGTFICIEDELLSMIVKYFIIDV